MSGEQMSFTFARAIGAQMAGLCAERAEDDVPDFSERAKAFVLEYLRDHGVSSSELITDAAKLAGLVPHDDRAFGAIYQSLARRKRIEFVGFCARRKGHGTAGGRLWRLGDGATS